MATAPARPVERAGLLDVAADGVHGGLERRRDRVRPDGLPADGVDPDGRAVERGLDPRGQVPDGTTEAFDLARPGDEPPGPSQDDGQRRRQGDEGRDGEEDGELHTAVPGPVSAGPAAELLQQRRADLDEIADDEDIREVGDGSVRVAVDRHDRARGLHADLVLDRAADAEREIELWLHDLAGLADLLAVRDPARVDGRPRRPDRAAQRGGQVLEQREARRSADPATTGDDDPRIVDRDRRALGDDAIDDRDAWGARAFPAPPRSRPFRSTRPGWP